MGIISERLLKYIWFNGEFIDAKDANIHILTHSLHYAGAAYEGEMAYSGQIFKLEEHVVRLMNSTNILKMNLQYNLDEIVKAHKLFIEKNEIVDNIYVRPLVWRGSETLNIASKALSVNIMIAAVKIKERERLGLKLHVSRWKKPHPEALPPQCKSSGNYTMSIIAKEEAAELGYDDAIFLDWRGYVAECSTSNIFFVQEDCIITPIADSFLNGITRQTIIEMAKNLGMKVIEKYILLDDLQGYDECFLTGTAAEISGVKSINLADRQLIFEKNTITSLLQKKYHDLVHNRGV